MTTITTLAAELRAEAAELAVDPDHTDACVAQEKLAIADRLDALARERWRPIAECPNDLSDAFMARVYGHGMPPDFGIGYCHTSGRPVAYDSCGEQFDPTHFLPPPPTGDA